MKQTANLRLCIHAALDMVIERRHQFFTPEHILAAIAVHPAFREVARDYHSDRSNKFYHELRQALDQLPSVPEDIWEECYGAGEEGVSASNHFRQLMSLAELHAGSSGRQEVDITHVLFCMFDLDESMAGYLLHSFVGNRGEFISRFTAVLGSMPVPESLDISELPDPDVDSLDDEGFFADDYDSFGVPPAAAPASGNKTEQAGEGGNWKSDVICINDIVDSHNPLIGRERELERTVQVLCRKEKNNPLHLGEPGVGKTALVYGLARMINEGRVPERLRGARIYRLDMGSLVAGTRYRGDFEEKLQRILKGASEERNAILYIDEIHTIMGAGSTNGDSLDASNILKRYLEESDIRFIGATTFAEHKRTLARSGALSRRFQEIEVAEPTEEEAIRILEELRPIYEEFHAVSYGPGVIEMAVRESARHIHGRFLPDKAIDLIDEAGAWREMHRGEDGGRVVDTAMLSEVLARVAKVDALAVKEENSALTRSLAERVLADVYGQDAAVTDVVESVLMARAGLTEEHHPQGAFLFVGPTGVGKTELARVLAREMGIGLVRFDMSEYSEKHSVAKLIGSPAGYVGYEDGGLLTDAIRKQPNCVLLLDEIEKAHSDIYNILLQVMDYAKLTDNQGRQADFSNVVLIMTSNAGAQFASRASVGFAGGVSAGQAMMKEVKRVFKPEFLNRLTAIEVFNDMDAVMGGMILDKALRGLHDRLGNKGVTLNLTEAARRLLLDRGTTREYGARELHRVIEGELTRPISREILFGRLIDGGNVTADVSDGVIKLIVEPKQKD